MSQIAQRTKLIAIAMIVPAVAAIAFIPDASSFSAGKAPHIVAGGPIPVVSPSSTVLDNHCPTCM